MEGHPGTRGRPAVFENDARDVSPGASRAGCQVAAACLARSKPNSDRTARGSAQLVLQTDVQVISAMAVAAFLAAGQELLASAVPDAQGKVTTSFSTTGTRMARHW